jgi:hypothetical protein
MTVDEIKDALKAMGDPGCPDMEKPPKRAARA